MNKFLSMLPKIFTNDSNALLHFCGALTHTLTMAFCLYYPWLKQYSWGGFAALPIATLWTLFLCWKKEKTDTSGFSKLDMQIGIWGIAVASLIYIVVLNIHNGIS